MIASPHCTTEMQLEAVQPILRLFSKLQILGGKMLGVFPCCLWRKIAASRGGSRAWARPRALSPNPNIASSSMALGLLAARRGGLSHLLKQIPPMPLLVADLGRCLPGAVAVH